MYKQEGIRKKLLTANESMDDYINKLGIKIEFSNKDEECLERIAQLTQKTNQFNFTTKRYTVNDIKFFFNSSSYDVVSIRVSDNFGNFGVTGLCILNYESNICQIDSFLMSCRILGRNIEHVFLDELFKFVTTKRKFKLLSATYNKTKKNIQVENFFELKGFEVIYKSDESKKYQMKVKNYNMKTKYNIATLWKKK